MSEIHLSAPVIARLKACSIQAVHKQMNAGRFGELIRRGRIAYAALPAIERSAGRRFTPEQVAAAVDGRPDRIIVFEPETT